MAPPYWRRPTAGEEARQAREVSVSLGGNSCEIDGWWIGRNVGQRQSCEGKRPTRGGDFLEHANAEARIAGDPGAGGGRVVIGSGRTDEIGRGAIVCTCWVNENQLEIANDRDAAEVGVVDRNARIGREKVRHFSGDG